MLLTMSPIYDRRGRIVGASTMARDITDRRRAQAAIEESEDRFRATFDQAAVGIAHVAPDGRFLRVNQKLCAIVGYTAAELLARTFQDITHPDDLDTDLAYVRQMLAGERRTYSMEKRYFRKEGSIVWVNLTVSLTRNGSGQPKYFISVVEDISQRKKAEEGLGQSEARYRRLFENSPISLWEQDFSAVKEQIEGLRRQGVADFRAYFQNHPEVVAECVALVRILALNQASLELYGAESKAEMLTGLEGLVPPEAHQLFVDELVWIAQGRTAFTWEGVNRKLTGEPVDIRLHWAVAPGFEETLERVLVSIEDITAHKRAESAL